MDPALLKEICASCEANICYSLPEQETVSTGFPQFDAVIGGGIPLGRIVEIFGAEDSGKTALALHLAHQIGGPVLYADADHKLTPHILHGRGLYLLDVETLENTMEACKTAIIGGFRAVVVDTVTALPTRRDIVTSINDRFFARENLQAKVMAKAVPILNRILHVSGCTLFLVNQLRNKQGVIYGRPDIATGGNAIKNFAALRLETKKIELVRTGAVVKGQTMAVDVVKCKYAPPGKRVLLTLAYDEGLSA